MKVGASIFCQNFFRTQRPDPDIYREDLALADLAEPLGFDSIWAVEHHFSPYTMIPDVTQFLSYLCGRTKRIGLATMVIVLPWHDPVRVAEEIAMLDLFARDRELTLGFGRGSGRIEYEGLRIPMNESRERFCRSRRSGQAGVDRGALFLQRTVLQGPGDDHPAASRAQEPDRPLFRRDRQSRNRRHHGAGGDGDADHPAKGLERTCQGLSGLPGFMPQIRPERAGVQSPLRGSTAPRTKRPPRSAATSGWQITDLSALVHYEYNEPEHFKNTKGYEFHAKMAEAMSSGKAGDATLLGRTQCFGTPERCLEVLREIKQTVDAEEFVGVFKYGGMPLEEAERSMKLFAAEVLPKVHAENF